MRKNLIRDFALASFVIAAIAYTQATGVAIPASHVYAFGQNVYGFLGIGSNTSPASPFGVEPTGVISKDRFTSIDGGSSTSIAISSNGSVYTWGLGFGGGLGYNVPSAGTAPPMERVPRKVPAAFNAFPVAASAGADHMLVAFDNGAVWSWGSSNTFGQLGHAQTGVPQVVPLPVAIQKVTAGNGVSYAIDMQGALWAWGLNTSRQLGMPGTFSVPTQVPNLPPLTQIASGGNHTVALAADGSVWAWGGNAYGQAGQPSSVSIADPAQVSGLANIVSVAAGNSQSFALAADGSVWGWGMDRNLGVNASGLDTTSSSSTPRQVLTQTTSLEPLAGVVSIAAGNDFAIAVLDDGRYAVWGAVAQRSLGFGTATGGFPVATIQPRLEAPIVGAAAGAAHGFLIAGDPPITTTWQVAPSVACSATTTATLRIDGYSISNTSATDVMLALDESGSLDNGEFNQLRGFASNFVNGLDMTTTRVGIVMFDDTARLILAPTSDRTTILNAINTVVQGRGNTCIGCGLNTADQTLDQHQVNGAGRYIIVVTDGENNVPSQGSKALQEQFLNAAIANAHNGNTVVSVGVGSLVNVQELTQIASSIPGLTTVFTSPDFDSLDNLVSGLLASVVGPGASNARLDVDLGPAWNIVAATPSSNTSPVTISGNHTFGWTLPTLDSAGATLQLVLRALTGGTHQLPASQVYSDQENNAFAPGAARSINVTGCPSSLALTPDGVSTVVNTQRQISATLKDDFGAPIANAVVRFRIVSGPRASASFFSSAITNALGVATTQFTSQIAVTDGVQASLLSNPAVVSNIATYTWLPPNNPPVANAGPNQTITLSGSPTALVTLDGSATTDDGERQPLTYTWSSINGLNASGVTTQVSLPRGSHTIMLTVSDGEFTRTSTVLITVVDVTPPVVTADVAGSLGTNGWYVSDVSVSFSFDDLESGVASTSNCQAAAIVSDTAGQTFTCDVTNGAGLTQSASITIKRDATKPTVNDKAALTGPATGPDGAHAPYSSPGAFDAMSGLTTSLPVCDPPSGALFPIGTTVVTCTATDNAGNVGSNSFTITVNDPTPPVITPNVAGLLGNNGWYRGDVVVSWTVVDPHSGVGSTNGCGEAMVSTDTASTTFTCTATNNAGVSSSASVTIKRDATPPVVSTSANVFASAVTEAGAFVSYSDASAVDDLSGLVGAVACAPVSGSLFAIGTTSVTCSVSDAAGNIGAASFDVTVGDTTPPSIVASVSGTPGSNGWFTSPVQIAWTVSDPQSSVTANGCDPVTLSADTAGVTLTCSASSAGGASSASETVKIDQTGPSISTPGNITVTTTSTTGTSVSYSASASDATSGLAAGVSCAPASGSFFALGATTVTCTASDNAGNATSSSFTVTVSRPGGGNGGGSGGGNGGGDIGNIHGQGHVLNGADKVFFDFSVRQTTSGQQNGSVDLRVKQGTRNQERFEARTVSSVQFTSTSAVTFSGVGKWDGQSNFTYVAQAIDNGEPGRGLDGFSIEVRAPNGAMVYSATGVLNDGNIQAKK